MLVFVGANTAPHARAVGVSLGVVLGGVGTID